MRKTLTIAALPTTLLAAGLCFAGEDIPIDQLPAPVRSTVERETKGGQITDIERDREAGQVVYEIEFSLDGKQYELDVAPDGKLLERRLD